MAKSRLRRGQFKAILVLGPKAEVPVKITTPNDLGMLIRERREAIALKQGDLASIAGVDQGNLSKIERGNTTATLETYLRLCAALGIDILAEPRK